MFSFKLTPLLLACGLPCALLVASCGGGASGPAAPFAPTALGANQPAAAGATISGTARLSGSSSSGASLNSGASLKTALGPAALVVRVVGTTLQVVVDSSGQFTLEGVPSGNVQLHFEGAGINATLTLPAVQEGQTLIIVVVLAGNNAELESDSRNGSVDDDSADDDADDDSADDDSADDDAADDDSADDDADDDSKDDDSKDGSGT